MLEGKPGATDRTLDNPDGLPPKLAENWKELEIELAEISQQLDDMRAQPKFIGEHALQQLEQRYDDVSRLVIELRHDAQKEFSKFESSNSNDARSDMSTRFDGMMAASQRRINEIGSKLAETMATTTDKITEKVKDFEEGTASQRQEIADATLDAGKRAKLAASDIGAGFRSAWLALRRDVGKAYTRFTQKKRATE